jgi:hypothetical protein
MTGDVLLDMVARCDGCTERAPALCAVHEKVAREVERFGLDMAGVAMDLLAGQRNPLRLVLPIAPPPAAPPAKCEGCGQFLTPIRVEMGLPRCSDCDPVWRRR